MFFWDLDSMENVKIWVKFYSACCGLKEHGELRAVRSKLDSI